MPTRRRVNLLICGTKHSSTWCHTGPPDYTAFAAAINQEAEDVGTSVSFARAEPPSQVLAQPELQTPARHFSRLPWGL